MLTQSLADPRSWSSATIDPPAAWYYRLSSRFFAVPNTAAGSKDQGPRPITDARLSEPQLEVCRQELAPIAAALEYGRGFAIVTGALPTEAPPLAQTLAYWLLGQGLGVPMPQNVQGTLLYDVSDTGQDVAYGARFSVTSAESSFHTDNSFGDAVVDYVGLLCLRGAQSGGLSQLVSGWTVYQELLAAHPDLVDELSRPFHFDRRGGVRPGETATAEFPVVRKSGQQLLYRYLRYWIETGHQKGGIALTPAQRRALDVLEAWLARPELRVEFTLKPGEVLFVNNRWILHNRTAFEDYPEPERKRHYVRLWLMGE